MSLGGNCSEGWVNWSDLSSFDLFSVAKVYEEHAIGRTDWVRIVCKLHFGSAVKGKVSQGITIKTKLISQDKILSLKLQLRGYFMQ